ncbi:MAG: NAD+ synthase (glutamine-hydrolyzing), partial [Halieaceae bacterium]
MHILMSQINTAVGDFDGNAASVLHAVRDAVQTHTEPVVVFPELTLSGYPPEDLLLRPAINARVEAALTFLLRSLPPAAWVVLGYPIRREGALYNAAAVLHDGRVLAEYHKQELPNYQVFDEKRYFSPGSEPCVVEIQGVKVGLTVCEDIWAKGPAKQAAAAGAQLLINLNASPYHRGKQRQRLDIVADQARSNGFPIVYVNQVGGQDELVFDGGSFAVNRQGDLAVAAPHFAQAAQWCELSRAAAGWTIDEGDRAPALDELAAVWQALVLGVRDYVNKNGFPGVVLGLSGG